MNTHAIRISVVGVGNCASSLIQGITYYRQHPPVGMMHELVDKYRVTDIKPVMAFDVDSRKVGKDLSEAIFALPNCTRRFAEVPPLNAPVLMGPVLDGVADHMRQHVDKTQTFLVADIEPVDVVATLREYQVEIVVSFLPVGSAKATAFYANAAIEAGCAFVNCIPSFVASDPDWAHRFEETGLPVLGDDIKAQLGATYLHRTLIQAALDRGLKIMDTTQYNQGGNTDFLNMTAEARLEHKLESKRQSIASLLPEQATLPADAYFGPGDVGARGHGWLPEQQDRKTATIRLDALMWGATPATYEIRLDIEDSPDSAGCSADAIRCARIALDRGYKGAVAEASGYFFKHPPITWTDSEARRQLDNFIASSYD
jgi:myo-inositol-1-phosphate synthase